MPTESRGQSPTWPTTVLERVSWQIRHPFSNTRAIPPMDISGLVTENEATTSPTLLQLLDSALQDSRTSLEREPSLDTLNLSIIDTLLTPEVRNRMQQFFPEDDIVTVNHSRKSEIFTPAGNFFRQLAVDGRISWKTFVTLFDVDGRWKLRAPEDLHIYDLSPEEAGDKLEEIFGVMYEATTPSLEVARPQFNMHDRTHLTRNRALTQRILKEVEGITDYDLRLGHAISVLHDGANMFARDEHPLVVLFAAYRSMPQLFTDNPSLFYAIAVGILIHHSQQITTLLEKRGLSMDDAVPFLEKLGPAANAHVIGDTADIGRPRVNLNGSRNDVLFEDPHTETQAYWHTSFVGLDPEDNSTFNLQLSYDPFVTNDEVDIFKDVQRPSTHGERRLIPHHEVEEIYQQNGTPYFITHSNKVMNIYGVQFALAAISAFAMHHQVNQFVVDYYDPSLRESLQHKPEYAQYTPGQWEELSHRRLTIKRGEVEAYLAELREGNMQLLESPFAA